MKPFLSAAMWISLYLAAVLTPLIILLLAPGPPGGGVWWDLAMGLGFAALVMLCVQFLLTARFRRATAPFGIDLIYYFHRYLAYVAVVLVLAHPLLLIALNPALISYLTPRGTPWEMNAGVGSVVLLLILVLVSVWRKRLGIPYEAWRVTHLVLAMGIVGLAMAHIAGVAYYTATPVLRGLWIAVGGSVLGVVLWVRVWRPWQLLRRPFRVTGIQPEPGRSWALSVEPEGHPGFQFLPGQFAWITIGHSPFAMQDHPFSIASSPSADGRLEFTIKELGDFTRTVGGIQPGTRVHVDGPYGSFSPDRFPHAAGYVFIAGGIGIAPMVGMLRALAERGDRRCHVLFAAHSHWDRVPLGGAVARLERQMELKVVHVVEEPPRGWTGEAGWITEEMLARHLPAARGDLHYFVCGPTPMIRAVEGFLQRLDVSPNRVHSEIFELV